MLRDCRISNHVPGPTYLIEVEPPLFDVFQVVSDERDDVHRPLLLQVKARSLCRLQQTIE